MRKPTRPRKPATNSKKTVDTTDTFLEKITMKCGSLSELLTPKKPVFTVQSAARFKTAGELRKATLQTLKNIPAQVDMVEQDLVISSDEEDGEICDMLY